MIVAVRKNGIACIGADTCSSCDKDRKTSASDVIHNEKILSVGKSFVGAERDPSLPLVLGAYFKNKKKIPLFDSRENIFEELLVMHRSLQDEYFLKPYQDDCDVFESIGFQMLIANTHGIFGTYYFRSVQEYSRFYAIGDGAEYALGALEAMYNTKASSEELVKAALTIASDFDASVGKPGKIFSVKLK